MTRTFKSSAALSALAALLLAGTLGVVGCSADASGESAASDNGESATAVGFTLDGYDLTYTDRDMDPSYDEAEAVTITLSDSGIEAGEGVEVDGSTATITAEGVYVVSGTLSDGQLVVDADDAKVQIVLDGASITNSSGPAIYVANANKVFLTLADGSENYVADASGYELTDDDGSGEPEGAIFSKDDLTIQGGGSLTVEGKCNHGIVCKDDLVITDGTYQVTAVGDAIYGNESLKVAGGSFAIDAGEDALKSNTEDEEGKGFVLVDGGSFTIEAGDDAVHAETALVINGGTINVTSCVEGLEGQTIYVNGGDTSISASDDAVNATSGVSGEAASTADAGMTHMAAGETADESVLLQINGGTLTLDCGGDGLDSNGSFEMNGGTVYLSGPTSGGEGSLDYNGSGTITGGTIIAAGSSGMAMGFTGDEQAFALVSASGNAGDAITVRDANGNELASMTATESFQCVVVSVDGMEAGTYTLSVNGTETSFEASTEGTAMGGMGQPGGAAPQDGGQMGGQPQGGMRP